ncbi:hypothetical protein [Dermacoccus nishinomiyaensis]|nr:hypothetical protein [Dermacoccus nishinomiyaensis]
MMPPELTHDDGAARTAAPSSHPGGPRRGHDDRPGRSARPGGGAR